MDIRQILTCQTSSGVKDLPLVMDFPSRIFSMISIFPATGITVPVLLRSSLTPLVIAVVVTAVSPSERIPVNSGFKYRDLCLR